MANATMRNLQAGTDELPMRIFTVARSKRADDEKRGVRPKSPRSSYTTYVKGAAAALDISIKEFEDLYSKMEEKYSREMRAQERDEAIESFREVVSKYQTPSGLMNIVKKKRELVEYLSSEEDPIDLVLVITDEGKLDVEVRRPRRVRSTDGEVSETSRISSWEAYLRGQRAGDTFKVTKLRTRLYRDDATGDTFENLTRWLRQNHPDSEAAKVLARYGQL